jgi:hypothetical protein
MTRRLTLLGALLALLAFSASAQAASIWTPVSSGTSDTISAIDYQSATRFWYATTNGKIAFWNGSSFTQGTGITPGENFNDLAFQPGAGSVGYAVTNLGHVWRTTDAGVSWSQLAPLMTATSCGDATPIAVSELNSVVWANSATVFLMGSGSTIMRSLNATAGSPTFAEINKPACSLSGGSTQSMTDATFLPANPDNGIFVDQEFGQLFASSNAVAAGTPGGIPISSGTVNAFDGNPRIARDASNPNRLWVVDHQSGGSGCGTLCLMVSTDGGNNSTPATFPNDTHVTGGLYGVSSQGGVEVTAGSGGEVFTSVDGINFYNQPADGTLATENWRAEGAYDAQHAAIGGENGALAITAAANTIPDIIAPTGTISGPTTATSGKATRYTAVLADNTGGSGINPSSITWTAPGFLAQHGATATYTFPRDIGAVTLTVTFADNAGNQGTATLDVTVNNARPPGPPTASQPTTISTGGATIKIFKVVTVTGRNARFIPIIVSSTKPRKFTAKVVPVKGNKRKALATGHLTLKGKHGGHGTLRVRLSAKVKPGTYLIVVRETTLHGRNVGKLIKIKFTLR